MRDFSYLENISNARNFFLMFLCIGFVVAIMLVMWGFSNLTEVERQYMTEHQFLLLQFAFTGGLIIALIGIIFLIHYIGGVNPKDVFAYQLWCQAQFKRLKEERKKK